MRFRMHGEDHDLTREQVEKAMKGVEPEAIRQHHVEVNGVRFPMKQVFGKVTGKDRLDFTTLEARRVLVRLGFTVGRS